LRTAWSVKETIPLWPQVLEEAGYGRKGDEVIYGAVRFRAWDRERWKGMKSMRRADMMM